MRGDFDEDDEDDGDPSEFCPDCGAHVSEDHAMDCGFEDDDGDDDEGDSL